MRHKGYAEILGMALTLKRKRGTRVAAEFLKERGICFHTAYGLLISGRIRYF